MLNATGGIKEGHTDKIHFLKRNKMIYTFAG